MERQRRWVDWLMMATPASFLARPHNHKRYGHHPSGYHHTHHGGCRWWCSELDPIPRCCVVEQAMMIISNARERKKDHRHSCAFAVRGTKLQQGRRCTELARRAKNCSRDGVAPIHHTLEPKNHNVQCHDISLCPESEIPE